MTAKIKRAVRLRIREAEMLERIRPPFLIGAARGILEFFLRFFFLGSGQQGSENSHFLL